MDDREAEAMALATAVAESDADPRCVPHEVFREWLLRLATGGFRCAGARGSVTSG